MQYNGETEEALPNFHVYIASCTEQGGIFGYRMDHTGRLTLIEKTALDRPMYMAIHNEKMHVVLREPFGDNRCSGVVSFDIDGYGKLSNSSDVLSTMGIVACHIAVDGDDLYCANYASGSIIKLPDLLMQHTGKGIDPQRQEAPHAHFVGLTPDNRYICAVDLGLDTVFVYRKDFSLASKASVPAGHGARHIVFSDDGRYMFCANELRSTVSAFAYRDGMFEMLDTVSTLPDDCFCASTTAAIRYHNGKIYVSNRGHDSISEVILADRKLRLNRTISCHGRSPRDFNFIGDFMICANEAGNNVSVFDIGENFNHIGSYAVDKPLCVAGIPERSSS